MKNLITLLFITSTAYIFNDPVIAQNPIIRDQFTADPSERVFNGRVYLYPSHDILAKEGKGRPGWFCMEYYHVFSSENLTDWTDHGVIVSQNLVKWVDTARFGHGSPHGQDVAYDFMHLDPSNPQTTKSDIEISEAMGTCWTNFAKYGQPNGEGVPGWPAFSDANPMVMYLGPTPHTGPVSSEESLKVLDSYFEWRRTPEVEAWAK